MGMLISFIVSEDTLFLCGPGRKCAEAVQFTVA